MLKKNHHGFAYHTPGQSKARAQARADLRSRVVRALGENFDGGHASVYAGHIAEVVGATPQAVVMALTLLVRNGEVVKEGRGQYRLPAYNEL